MYRTTIEQLTRVMESKGYAVFDGNRPFNLNIVGIRKPNAIPNSFDDTIVVFYHDEHGSPRIHHYPATTDPGLYWLQNPMNVEGTAILKEGQYRGAYKLGQHKGYTALEQIGEMDFIRDNDRDAELDFDCQRIETGVIKANIHRANASDTSTQVNKWSAGCQVIPMRFASLIFICEKALEYYSNSFTYTLLNERDFETLW